MAESAPKQTLYSLFWLYRADPAFHALSEGARDDAKASFLAALEGRDKSVTLRGSYSLVGLRANADLLLWAWGADLDALQRLAIALRHSGLGRYLTQVETYLGVVSVPRYDPEHGPAFVTGAPPKRYVSVYPFVKTTDWYLSSYDERRRMMAEHGQVGRKYAVSRERVAELAREARGEATASAPSATATATATEEGGGVLSNTVDSFALGDYEFILANESDDPAELKDMMLALRAVESRKYTALDVPIYFGRLRAPAEALADL
ncbi:MAG TPA: chlorite dismutase family protein [Ktedonobacterales bacterium]|jgi:chlorite dismutase|nr:chlorite dismutase family protein [Ktedonobacterales bacterium]